MIKIFFLKFFKIFTKLTIITNNKTVNLKEKEKINHKKVYIKDKILLVFR